MKNKKLSKLETVDTGKALQETLVADAASAADALEFFGGIISGFNGEFVELGGSFAYTRREALGICVGIGAWNYPIQIAAWKSAPALAMGNAFIFKPSENTPSPRSLWLKPIRKQAFPMVCSTLFRVLVM